MSARNSVQSPLALKPAKELKVAVRAVESRTMDGSTFRPSGCQVPVNGEPAAGVTTAR